MAIAPPQRPHLAGPSSSRIPSRLPGARFPRSLFRFDLVTPWCCCASPMTSKSPMQNQGSTARRQNQGSTARRSGFTRLAGCNAVPRGCFSAVTDIEIDPCHSQPPKRELDRSFKLRYRQDECVGRTT